MPVKKDPISRGKIEQWDRYIQILDGLDKEERQLIYLRYFQEKTQAAVGEILGISQVQVSRMEKKILERMRKQM